MLQGICQRRNDPGNKEVIMVSSRASLGQAKKLKIKSQK